MFRKCFPTTIPSSMMSLAKTSASIGKFATYKTREFIPDKRSCVGIWMVFWMNIASSQNKIIKFIILFILNRAERMSNTLMMNKFRRLKFSPKVLLHNVTVFRNCSSVYVKNLISSTVNAKTRTSIVGFFRIPMSFKSLRMRRTISIISIRIFTIFNNTYIARKIFSIDLKLMGRAIRLKSAIMVET